MRTTMLFLSVAALASTAFAAPAKSITGFTKRQQGVATFDCQKAYTDCTSEQGADPSYCSSQFSACNTCSSQEVSCRTNADYSQQLACTKQAQTCYYKAEGSGSTEGVYGCKQLFDTCKNAPLENNSFCASQQSGCQSCESQENACRNAPDANEAYCSSQASNCIEKSIDYD